MEGLESVILYYFTRYCSSVLAGGIKKVLKTVKIFCLACDVLFILFCFTNFHQAWYEHMIQTVHELYMYEN